MRRRKSSPIIKAKRHRSSASSKNSKNYNLASKIAMAAIAMYIGYNVRKKIDQRKIKVLEKHLISLTKNNQKLFAYLQRRGFPQKHPKEVWLISLLWNIAPSFQS